MSKKLDQLYTLMMDHVELDPESREKRKALAVAKLAILDELHRARGEEVGPLLEVLDLLEAESEFLHDRALFSAALELGMELGRLPVS